MIYEICVQIRNYGSDRASRFSPHRRFSLDDGGSNRILGREELHSRWSSTLSRVAPQQVELHPQTWFGVITVAPVVSRAGVHQALTSGRLSDAKRTRMCGCALHIKAATQRKGGGEKAPGTLPSPERRRWASQTSESVLHAKQGVRLHSLAVSSRWLQMN